MVLGKKRKAGAKPSRHNVGKKDLSSVTEPGAANPAAQRTGGKDEGNRFWEQSIPSTKTDRHGSDPFSAAVLLATRVSQDSCKG